MRDLEYAVLALARVGVDRPHGLAPVPRVREQFLDRVQPDLEPREEIVVTCSVGHRASLASSILLRNGYPRVGNLLGGMTAWNELDLPTVTGDNELTTFEIEGPRS